MRHLRFAAAAMVLTTLSACASDFGGSVSNSKDVLSPAERRLQAVETRVGQLSQRLDAVNVGDLDRDNQRMRDEIRGLRGDIEKIRYDLEQTKRSQLDLQTRMTRLEGGAAAAAPSSFGPPPAVVAPVVPVAAPAPAAAPAAPAVAAATQPLRPPVTPPPPAPNAVAPTTDPGAVTLSQGAAQGPSADEQAAYLSAFDKLGNGKYDEAIAGFRGQLEKWPQGAYADNALYWSGEAFYVKRDYKSALAAFQGVLTRFPKSTKVPEATLKVGLTQMDMGQDAEGRATLQRVIKSYPGSTAAKLAQQRLEPAKR